MTCSGTSKSNESHRAPEILTRRIIVYRRATTELQKVGTRYDLIFIGIGKEVVHLPLRGLSVCLGRNISQATLALFYREKGGRRF
jgi:hypothetical protein